jgi:hypothetical protein
LYTNRFNRTKPDTQSIPFDGFGEMDLENMSTSTDLEPGRKWNLLKKGGNK